MQKVLILGGGAGGVILANSLDRDKFDITVLDKSDKHFYQPWYLYVAFKGSRRNISKPIRKLLKPHVKFYQDEAIKVDMDKKQVLTASKKEYSYDYLIIATGTTTDKQYIQGLPKINELYGDYHTNLLDAELLWKNLEQFKGGKIVLGQATTVCKCPPSMLEGIFLLEEYIHKKGLKDKTKITYFTPFPRAYSAEPINSVVEGMIKERGIEVLTFFDVDNIDNDKKIIHSIEGDDLSYDFPIIVPPCRGVNIEYDHPEILDEDRFIKVDKHTMKVNGFENVYAIGDANNLPISKTGVTAHLEAKVLAERFNGTDPNAQFNGRINCPFDVGYGKATFVIGDYKEPTVPYPPSRTKHFMKMMMVRIYWMSLKGTLDFMFNYYFKRTDPAKLNKKFAKKGQKAAEA